MPSSTACYSIKPLSEVHKTNPLLRKVSSVAVCWEWVCFSFLVSQLIDSDAYIYKKTALVIECGFFVITSVGKPPPLGSFFTSKAAKPSGWGLLLNHDLFAIVNIYTLARSLHCTAVKCVVVIIIVVNVQLIDTSQLTIEID